MLHKVHHRGLLLLLWCGHLSHVLLNSWRIKHITYLSHQMDTSIFSKIGKLRMQPPTRLGVLVVPITYRESQVAA